MNKFQRRIEFWALCDVTRDVTPVRYAARQSPVFSTAFPQ